MTATDPQQSEQPDDAVDLNPERCTFTRTDIAYMPSSLRCTARADEEHEHRWDSDEQQRWTDETRTTLLEAMPPARIGDRPAHEVVAERAHRAADNGMWAGF